MVTTVAKYTKGQIDFTTYKFGWVDDLRSCVKATGITANAAVVSTSYESSESRTLTRGDRVHSTPFTGQYLECSPLAGSFSTTFKHSNGDQQYCGAKAGTTYSHVSDIGAFVSVPAPLPVIFGTSLDFLEGSANTKALANLRRSYYSLGIILVERMRTIGYITSKVQQLTALLKARTTRDLARYMQSRKTDRKRLAKDLAGEHLGFVFGLLPLINEIQGLADLLADDETLTITGRGRQATEVRSQEVLNNTFFGASDLQWPRALRVTNSYKTKLSVRTSVSVTVDIAAFQKMRDHGLNPVATAYDIVPLLFLADFISNLGTFLRSYDPLIGVSFKTGNTTYWRESRVETDVVGYVWWHNALDSTSSTGAGKGFKRQLIVERKVLTQYPEASLHFQNNLSVAKAATIASLIIQRAIKPVRAIKAIRDFRYRGPRPKYLPPIKYQKVK